METRTARGNRVVVTGTGLLTPIAHSAPDTWQALLSGKSGAAPIKNFDTTGFEVTFAAEVKDFDPSVAMERKEAKRMDRFAQFAMVAAVEAMNSSGLADRLDSVNRDRIGVLIASGIGGITTFEEQSRVMFEKGPKRISPFFIPMFIPDIASGFVSMRYGLRGPNYCTVSACASSAHAVGDAFRILQRGDADAMLVGGAEATVTPMAIAGFTNMKALSERNDTPETASRPFDATRDGFVMGEGSGVLLLETLEHALGRGANIIAEVVGYGMSADAYHLTAPAPEGAGAQIAMRNALNDACIKPHDVDYVNAHGTSTPMNDLNETLAVKAVFGEHARNLVMGSTKSMTGHLLGAAGAVETVISALVCRDGKIPPTTNFSTPDPACDLNYAHNRMLEQPVRHAISNSFGFGGHNVCLVVKRWEN